MKQVNINNNGQELTYKIPEGWGDITIGEYCDYFKAIRVNPPETLLDINIKIICSFVHIDEDLIDLLPMDKFEEMVECLTFIKETKITKHPKESVEINGQTFYYKSNSDFTVGELRSIDSIMQQTGNNIFEATDKLLCLFLRQKDENGELEKFNKSFMKRSEMFRQLIVEDVMLLIDFFSNGVKK
jgi:hypothetical protein